MELYRSALVETFRRGKIAFLLFVERLFEIFLAPLVIVTCHPLLLSTSGNL
jgi:hypothetical protein